MVVSRTRLGVMMAVACFCFGCKGAGGALRVASAVAVTAARVATVAAVAAPSGGGGEPRDAPYEPQPSYEVTPQPQPGRVVVYGERVFMQDPETGVWHVYQ
jgi:hypothetical protein